jgi:crotonobetainyl-CoA:carnitine CoA-transferase CaiB-like acyl-CoA transferase
MSDLLDGIRVIEAAVLLNGDTVGMLLGDLGADVVKVEAPGTGDYLRDMLGQIVPHHSPAHVQVNKNKRSVTLDLRRDEGRAVFWDLLASADVFVDGFAGDACDRLGIGYEAQRARRPGIVYCQCSGYGRHGPYSSIPTHGQMMNAQAAAVPLHMDPDGFVRAVPSTELMSGTTIGGEGTSAGAVHTAFHVAAALWRRERTGAGCSIDVSAADAVIAQGWIGAVYGWNEHRLTDRTGLRKPGGDGQTGAKYQYYETSDGRFVLFCAIEPKFWRAFCEVSGRDDLAGVQVETGAVDFARDDEALRHALQTVFRSRTQQEWVQLAIEHRLPIGPAHQGVRSVLEDPHVRARQIVVEGSHPSAGPFTYVGEPAIVDGHPYRLRRPAPALGEHTDEILGELGYDAARIAELRTAGVV